MSAVSALIGAAVGGAIAVSREFFMKWRLERRHQTYLAVRTANQFEMFALGCEGVAHDNGTDHGRRPSHENHAVTTPIPQLDLDALNADWQLLPTALLNRVLSMPSKQSVANIHIDAAFEFAAHPPEWEEGFEARQKRYAELGIEALSVAAELRELAKVSSPIEELEDVSESLRLVLNDIEKRVERRHAIYSHLEKMD